MADVLEPGTSLAAGQQITSADGRHTLTMQPDGNLLLSSGGTPVWASGTNGSGGTRADMQQDGNLVIYKDDNQPIWASQTSGHDGARLVLANDRSLTVRASDGTELWNSGSVEEAAPAPEPTPEPQAAPAAPAAQTYTVQPGDTLSAIAKQYYGDANAYMRIAEASGIANPNLIHPGQVLTIP